MDRSCLRAACLALSFAAIVACEPEKKPATPQDLQSNPYLAPSPYAPLPPPPPFAIVAPTAPTAQIPARPPMVIRAGRMIDGTGGPPRDNVLIVIEGDKISKVGPAASTDIPSGAVTIDLSHATVLPGLIDCHVHLSDRADRYDEIYAFKDTPFDAAFAAVKNAKATLDAGFTTVRDLSSPPFLAVDLKRSIEEGFLEGPRVVASGPGISATGGHGDLNDYAPQVRVLMFPDERDFQIADGVDQIRHVVRSQLKYGVDVVKVFASGGVLSRGDTPGAPQYTLEELKTVVQEAHMAGRRVAAHAHGTRSIKDATIAGVDSIEHGSLIDDEGIKLMKQKGTWLVADIYNDDYILGRAKELKIPDEFVVKERQIGQLQRENFAKAMKAGVKIAYGTDAGVYPHGDNAKQFAVMVRYGMTPAAAIKSATGDAADLLGKSNEVGTIAPGKYADIIAVAADPLADVRALEHVGFVMKGGEIDKDEITKPACK